MRNRIIAGVVASLVVLGLAACDLDSTASAGTRERPTIGANVVPDGLHCEEDEVIAFVVDEPAPYELGCVHVEHGALAE